MKILFDKLKAKGIKHFANDNIAEGLDEKDLDRVRRNVEKAVDKLLTALLIDTENDHNTKDTAKRVAKMYVDEVFKGRYYAQPKITDFPNAKDLDQVYTVGPITVRSACSHHLVPITGHAWIGIIPSDRVIGISKFNRLTDWVMSRPQIQEEATVQLADLIEKLIKPKGMAVVVKATHQCMTWRGVKDNGVSMTTSVMRGSFREDEKARNEFLNLISSQGF